MTLDDDCRRLLALLTHEMRSPGAVVAGYLRMLKGPSTSA
jgi:signal transduction histidine kinase